MEVKLKDIIVAYGKLQSLLAKEHIGEINYKLLRLYKAMKVPYDNFIETRDKRIKELGTYNKKDDTYAVKKSNNKKFNDEMNKMLEEDVQLDAEKIDFHKLDCKMSTVDLHDLEWIFDF